MFATGDRVKLRAEHPPPAEISKHWTKVYYGESEEAQQRAKEDEKKFENLTITPEQLEASSPYAADLGTFSNHSGGERRLASMETLEPSSWSDVTVLRFLRARKMDVAKASKMFFHYIDWRDLYGVNTLAKHCPMPHFKLINSILRHNYHGYSKDGYPVYIQFAGQTNPVDFAARVTNEQLAITHVWFQEEVIRV